MDTIEQLTSVLHLEAAEWDAVAGDEVFWRHGWVRTVEESSILPDRARYFVARDGDGIKAAAVCHVQEPGESALGIDRVLFGRFASFARTLRFEVSPVLVCGVRVGLASHVRVRAGVSEAERAKTVDAMIDAMMETARAERRSFCFRNVIGHDARLHGALRKRGFVRAAEMPGNWMDVKWGTFKDYLRDLKNTHPSTAKGIAHEVNRARSRGIVFRRLEHPGAWACRLDDLLRQHHDRLNGVEFPYDADFLPRLCERLGDRVLVFAAFSEDVPIGVVIGFQSEGTLFFPFVGMDDERRKDSFAYFGVAYNEPIRYAIEAGMRSIYCGKLLYHVKLRRGFRPKPLYMYVRLRDPLRRAVLRPVAAGQIARVAAMVGRYDDRRRPGAEKPAW